MKKILSSVLLSVLLAGTTPALFAGNGTEEFNVDGIQVILKSTPKLQLKKLKKNLKAILLKPITEISKPTS